MKKLGAWFGLTGGILWAVKAGYDWIGLGREVNTGYPPSHFTDYLEFLIPLLCIGSMYVLASYYKTSLGKAPLVVSIGLLLTGAFHFSEVVFVNSGIPFGLLFLLTGLVTTYVGITLLAFSVKKTKHIPRSLLGFTLGLNITILSFCLSPFLRDFITNEQLTAITVVLSILVGSLWACIGGIAIVLCISKSSTAKELKL